MNRPPRYRRKAWRNQKPVPQSINARDKIFLAVSMVAAFLIVAALLQFATARRTAYTFEQSLREMRTKYALTDTQAASVRRLEFEFHKPERGVFRPSRTHAEEEAHKIELSRQMSAEAAKRFLAGSKDTPSLSHRH